MTLSDALAGHLLDPANVGLVKLPERHLWRIYARVFEPAGFNAAGKGKARFSPIEHAGAIVPTMYAATTVQAALMETVLHDAPSPSAGYILTLDRSTEQRRIAQLHTNSALKLADLSTVGLRRLGLGRSDVFDSDKSHYSETQKLAAWIYESRPDLQGLVWTSRQDDSAQSLMLFEPRIAVDTISVGYQDQEFTHGLHHDALVDLLNRLGASFLFAT